MEYGASDERTHTVEGAGRGIGKKNEYRGMGKEESGTEKQGTSVIT